MKPHEKEAKEAQSQDIRTLTDRPHIKYSIILIKAKAEQIKNL